MAESMSMIKSSPMTVRWTEFYSFYLFYFILLFFYSCACFVEGLGDKAQSCTHHNNPGGHLVWGQHELWVKIDFCMEHCGGRNFILFIY